MKKILLMTLFCGSTAIATAQTLKEAIHLNENEQQEAASGVFQQLLVKEPTNGTIYFYYGANLIDADQPDSARMMFEKGNQVDPTNQLNQIGLAELDIRRGNMADGKARIDNALRITAHKNALVLMEAGGAYIRYKEKDVQSAQTLLEEAAKLDPKNPEIFNLLGDVYTELNNGTMAANNYNKTLELEKDHVKALLHKGQLYKRSTNYEGAAIEFQNALKIDPNFAPAYRELGEVSFKMKKLDDAKMYYKKYLELSKNNNNARLRYAYFLYESDNYNDALTEIGNITKVDSTNLGMMRIMSYVYYEAGRNDSSLRTMRKVFDITMNDTTRRFARDYSYFGKAMAKSGNDSVGASMVKQALVMDPRQAVLYDDLADIHNKAKRYAQAAEAYNDKITNIGKGTTLDYFNMGKAWYNAKDYIKADTAFAQVTIMNPSWPNGHFWRGRTNAQLDSDGKQGLAIPYYSKYIELTEADSANVTKYKNNMVESYSTLAFVAFVKKDCKLSIQNWNKVLSIDPANEQAKKAITSISNSKDCK